ncbi:hypothetical protein GCM10008024_07820 [Allgaiera indica]|uniref:Transposase n=2 Tax=Allgaiera indica TaxID=765699 RepID=A0AAN4UP03_9RHOB|nr:hypothetical protein GCM10008024_07820 [Allgaiera indica]
MIAGLQAENARISATLQAHEQLVQALRLRIAKLQKQAFGKSSEKIEREIEQLELALEDLLIAVAQQRSDPMDDGDEETPPEPSDKTTEARPRRRPRVSDETQRERRKIDPGACCPDGGGGLRVVGEDVSEMLDMLAAQLKVLQIARVKKSCRRCESEGAIRHRFEDATEWCRARRPAVRSPAAWPAPVFWRMSWSRSSTTTSRFAG